MKFPTVPIILMLGLVVLTCLSAGCPPRLPDVENVKDGVDATSPWAEVSPAVGFGVTAGNYTTRRLAVPNGWLYLTIVHCSHGVSVSQVFVYDPSHNKLTAALKGPEADTKPPARGK